MLARGDFTIFHVIAMLVVVLVTVGTEIRNRIRGRAWAAAARALRFRRRWQRVAATYRIQGKLHGHKVIVDTIRTGRGEKRSVKTRYRVYLAPPLQLGLKLTREGLYSRVTRRDIQVGDREFDNEIHVKGLDPAQIIRYLNPARRVRIFRAMKSHPTLKVDDRMVIAFQAGVVQNPDRILNTVRRLAQLAFYLSARHPEDEKIEKAITAQRQGRIRTAIETAREVPTTHGVVPVEAKIIEAEALVLADQEEAAAEVFMEAREAAPEDPEIVAWTRQLTGEPRDSAESPDAPPERPLDVASVCDDLFPATGSSLEANQRFEAAYDGREIRWRGVLKTVQGFTYDYVFGSDPGTKAVFEIHETRTDLYGTRTVQAVVRLPESAQAELRDRIGETFTFEGRLRKADGFVRNIFVDDAKLMDG